MRRLATLLAIAAVLTLGSRGAGAAPPGANNASATTLAVRSPELATMVLQPGDLPTPGFGLEGSGRYGAEQAASDDSAVATLRDAGYVGGYVSWLASSESGSSTVDVEVGTFLDEFTDAAGAEIGFDYFSDVTGLPGYEQVAGARTIGDESQLVQGRGTNPNTDWTFDKAGIVFRLDRMVASIRFQDYAGRPTLAKIETLGDKLLARGQTGLAGGGPGTSDRTVYFLSQTVSDAQAAPVVLWRVAAFPSAQDATDFVAHYIPMNQRGAGGWTKVTTLPAPTRFGDESQTASYRVSASPGSGDGLAIVARFGTTAVVLRVEAFIPVPVSVEATTPCPTMSVPADLAALTAAGATPTP